MGNACCVNGDRGPRMLPGICGLPGCECEAGDCGWVRGRLEGLEGSCDSGAGPGEEGCEWEEVVA